MAKAAYRTQMARLKSWGSLNSCQLPESEVMPDAKWAGVHLREISKLGS